MGPSAPVVRAHVYVSAGVEASVPQVVGQLAAVFAQAYVSQDAVAAQLVVVLGLVPHLEAMLPEEPSEPTQS